MQKVCQRCVLDARIELITLVPMQVLRTVESLAQYRDAVLVPTMGGLHDGHLSLVRTAGLETGPVVVSIFVNPMQFEDRGDFETYPRMEDRDLHLLEKAGASAAFLPSLDLVYPPGNDVPPVCLPPVAKEPGLEDRSRPGHFAGVARVVCRLWELVNPEAAVFGEKDYQQLLLIRALAEEMRGPRIIACPTMREADGLAMSSRNRHLTKDERTRAGGVYRALQVAGSAPSPLAAEEAMREVLVRHDLEVEYAVVRDTRTLLPIASWDSPARALVAVRAGGTRLIDNIALPEET